MIVWVNGTFGAGKTTTARLLVKALPKARIFDPESVGYMLEHVLTEPIFCHVGEVSLDHSSSGGS